MDFATIQTRFLTDLGLSEEKDLCTLMKLKEHISLSEKSFAMYIPAEQEMGLKQSDAYVGVMSAERF